MDKFEAEHEARLRAGVDNFQSLRIWGEDKVRADRLAEPKRERKVMPEWEPSDEGCHEQIQRAASKWLSDYTCPGDVPLSAIPKHTNNRKGYHGEVICKDGVRGYWVVLRNRFNDYLVTYRISRSGSALSLRKTPVKGGFVIYEYPAIAGGIGAPAVKR